MANVKGSILLWLVCWGHSLLNENQIGGVTLGHWSMPITVPGILPWTSVCIFLHMGGNPAFQLMLP